MWILSLNVEPIYSISETASMGILLTAFSLIVVWAIIGVSNWVICTFIYYQFLNSTKFDAK